MGEGKLAAAVTLAIGFLVGYKWPKIRRELMPMYRKGMTRLKRYSRRGIHDAMSLFHGRTTGTRKPPRQSRKRVLASA